MPFTFGSMHGSPDAQGFAPINHGMLPMTSGQQQTFNPFHSLFKTMFSQFQTPNNAPGGDWMQRLMGMFGPQGGPQGSPFGMFGGMFGPRSSM